MSTPPERLRQDLDTLTALVQRASTHLGIDATFLEKDFWVTELLRAVAPGAQVPAPDGSNAHVAVVFKGGTSLSRVFGLTDRFSEDVDLLVRFPAVLGAGTRDRALKQIVAIAQEHLDLPGAACVTETSTKGVKRNVQFHYPRRFANPAVKEHLLLEMGSRGGPDPHAPHTVTSMVARYAIDVLGEEPTTWAEFAPVTIDVLAPERTLLEKCALLHNLAARVVRDNDEVASENLTRAGRHYYDVARLMADPGVRQALHDVGPEGVAALANDIDAASHAAGWRFEPRPDGGYANSPAFDPAAPCRDLAAASYRAAMAMVYGEAPSFGGATEIVRTHANLL